MRIVIATPLYPPDVGGPATVASHLTEEFAQLGARVRVVAYGRLERALPAGLRHAAYFLRLFPHALRADAILALDTWSVGVPALAAARLARGRLVLRIGGDFLWESYVGRTKARTTLTEFYRSMPSLSFKERLIRQATARLLGRADRIAFNTAWQRDLWHRAYCFDLARATVVENAFPAERRVDPPQGKVFVAAGRDHPLKQTALVQSVVERIARDHPEVSLDTQTLPPAAHHARLRDAYAVVIASLSEVNPNTAIDAIVAGKPFIAPRDSGAYERLKDVGIFVDMRDEAALEAAVRSLLDPAVYREAEVRVRAFSYARSWEAVARDFLAILS